MKNSDGLRKKARMITAGTMLLLIRAQANQTFAQDAEYHKKKKTGQEYYGRTLNLGVGLAYSSYFGQVVPFFGANYEIDVARQFTLAPFIGIASYQSNDYYYNNNNSNRYYYHETIVPLGIKATYYFDKILDANPNWDFYLAGSLGTTIRSYVWDNGYTGDRSITRGTTPLYIDLHIGAEYHFSRRVGVFLDLSTGISTIGLAIHGR